MEKGTQLKFAVLCLVPFIMVLGNSMLIPVLPSIKSALDITQLEVGLLITAFSVPAGLVIPFAGILSDHIGRKVIITPALIVYGLGGLIAGTAALLLSEPYYVILIGRIIQGIGAGGTYQLAMALTGDIFKSRERVKALGFLEASNGLGKVVSPLLGAAVGLISWYAPFFVYGVLSIPIAFAVWFAVFSSFWLLFASVVILGIGVGSVLPPVNTFITSSVSTKRRGVVTCLYGTVRFFGVAVGPPLYSYIEDLGKAIPLAFSSGIVILTLILAIIFITDKFMEDKKEFGNC